MREEFQSPWLSRIPRPVVSLERILGKEEEWYQERDWWYKVVTSCALTWERRVHCSNIMNEIKNELGEVRNKNKVLLMFHIFSQPTVTGIGKRRELVSLYTRQKTAGSSDQVLFSVSGAGGRHRRILIPRPQVGRRVCASTCAPWTSCIIRSAERARGRCARWRVQAKECTNGRMLVASVERATLCRQHYPLELPPCLFHPPSRFPPQKIN